MALFRHSTFSRFYTVPAYDRHTQRQRDTDGRIATLLNAPSPIIRSPSDAKHGASATASTCQCNRAASLPMMKATLT